MRRALRWLRRNAGPIAQVTALLAAVLSPSVIPQQGDPVNDE